MDDRFYIIVQGGSAWRASARPWGIWTRATVSARRATCAARSGRRPSLPRLGVVMKVSSTLLNRSRRVSAAVQPGVPAQHDRRLQSAERSA